MVPPPDNLRLRCRHCGAEFESRRPSSASSVIPSRCPDCGRVSTVSMSLTSSAPHGVDGGWMAIADDLEVRLEDAPTAVPQPTGAAPIAAAADPAAPAASLPDGSQASGGAIATLEYAVVRSSTSLLWAGKAWSPAEIEVPDSGRIQSTRPALPAPSAQTPSYTDLPSSRRSQPLAAERQHAAPVVTMPEDPTTPRRGSAVPVALVPEDPTARRGLSRAPSAVVLNERTAPVLSAPSFMSEEAIPEAPDPSLPGDSAPLPLPPPPDPSGELLSVALPIQPSLPLADVEVAPPAAAAPAPAPVRKMVSSPRLGSTLPSEVSRRIQPVIEPSPDRAESGTPSVLSPQSAPDSVSLASVQPNRHWVPPVLLLGAALVALGVLGARELQVVRQPHVAPAPPLRPPGPPAPAPPPDSPTPPAEPPPPAPSEAITAAAAPPSQAPPPARVFSPEVMKRLSQAWRLECRAPQKTRQLFEGLLQDGEATDLRIGLGACALAERRLDDARTHFERALAMSPASLAALRGLAHTCRLSGDLPRALELYRRYLENPLAPKANKVRKYVTELSAQQAGQRSRRRLPHEGSSE